MIKLGCHGLSSTNSIQLWRLKPCTLHWEGWSRENIDPSSDTSSSASGVTWTSFDAVIAILFASTNQFILCWGIEPKCSTVECRCLWPWATFSALSGSRPSCSRSCQTTSIHWVQRPLLVSSRQQQTDQSGKRPGLVIRWKAQKMSEPV